MQEELEISTLNIDELWNIFKRKVDMDEDYELFRQVLTGVKIEFNLINYLTGFNIKVWERTEKVRIGKKIYQKIDIDLELMLRERLMHDYLQTVFSRRKVASERKVEQ